MLTDDAYLIAKAVPSGFVFFNSFIINTILCIHFILVIRVNYNNVKICFTHCRILYKKYPTQLNLDIKICSIL